MKKKKMMMMMKAKRLERKVKKTGRASFTVGMKI
jgi:hypothetical protein